jgi:hypothetical protein
LFLWHGLNNAPFEPGLTHFGRTMKSPKSRICGTKYY